MYSCTKCYNIYENEDYDYYFYKSYASSAYEYEIDYSYIYSFYDNYVTIFDKNYSGYMPTKLLDKSSNINYCIKNNTELENCTEATYYISNGQEIYNCTKCLKDNNLIYNSQLKIWYCAYDINSATKCLVEYCKSCVTNKNYFCQSCLTSNYEINQFSGSCVLKTAFEPSITWKDIYRLILNDHKVINGRTYDGPSLMLRGITASQINSRHAFLIYLTFKIKNRLRNLQEGTNKTLSAICETEYEVEESNYRVNLADYKCIGDGKIPDESELIGIEGDDYNINSELLIGNDPFKPNPSYIEKDLENEIVLVIKNNTIDNTTFYSKKFNFSFNGELNKEIEELKNTKNISIDMKKIKEKTYCDFSKNNKDANFELTRNENNILIKWGLYIKSKKIT